MFGDSQYLSLGNKILNEGEWVKNDRTGTDCLTIIGHTMTYNVGKGEVPVLDCKRSFPVSAVAEMIGYKRKYTNAQQFANIGAKTWFKNANETAAWLANKNRKGENDMGLVYGAAMVPGELEKIYEHLKNGIDDRGETISFWRPELFDKGCLRPCMRTHTFSLVNGTLHLTSESRSVDYALGLNFNSLQCYYLLDAMAKITGNKPGIATHNLINVHIYGQHLLDVEDMLNRPKRKIETPPEFKINDWVKNLDDIIHSDKHAREYFTIENYNPQPAIEFEMVA